MADRRKVAPDRVISTVDRQARHTRKSRSKQRDGFRGHVAAEPGTELITDCEMTMAAGPGSTDADNGVAMAARDRFGGTAADGAEPGPEPQPEGAAPPGAGPADAPQAAGWRFTAIRPMAAGKPAPPTAPPGTTP